MQMLPCFVHTFPSIPIPDTCTGNNTYFIIAGMSVTANVTAQGSAGFSNLTLVNVLGAPVGMTSTPAPGSSVDAPNSLNVTLSWTVRIHVTHCTVIACLRGL